MTFTAFSGEAPDILAGLRPEHPRLIITAADWADIRHRRENEPQLDALLKRLVEAARATLTGPTIIYKKDGKRLLAVSRETLRRVQLCSFAYRVTGEKVFLDHAQKDLLTVAAFKDWNTTHFLDTAEMTAAVAIGYDWLFADLSPATRTTLRQAMIEKGLTPGLGTNYFWTHATMNWNQVCYGGLTLGALAIADEEPAIAGQMLTLAKKNNPHGLEPYAPLGVYPEGPGYWNYGTTYQVLMISALETALGTDWGLANSPGFLASAAALIEQIGPTGRAFNFSDGHESVVFDSTLFWFAQRLHDPTLVRFQNQILRQKLSQPAGRKSDDSLDPLLALWCKGLPEEIPAPTFPLAWFGDGPNPIGTFRSSWTDPNALFLAVKGGSASLNHAHMDAGSFVLDADGVRWASDLGAQDYLSIESKGWTLFKMTQDSDRWRVFRLNNFSHNTLTLGGQLHNVKGDTRITRFTTNSATIDLSEIFSGQASNVVRQFTVGENRSVRIRDEINSVRPGLSVRWQMVTAAKIKVEKNRATLLLNGKTLAAKIISPAGANFEIASAQPPDDGVNEPNPGFNMLAVNVTAPTSGNLVLEIELQPIVAPGK
jgi:hypothetical protein